MNIGNVVQHLRETSKHYGRAAALYDLEYRGLNHLTKVSVLRGMTAVVEDVDPRLFDAGPFASRFCTRSELMAAAHLDEVRAAMSPDFVERALSRGDECFGIFDEDRLASFGWYSSRPTNVEDDLSLHFDPAWVYMYKGFTLGAYRGKRLHGIGMSLALREYTQRGSRGLISYVEGNNFASLRSTEKMGYKQFGAVYVARVRGKVFAWSSPGCKPYGFRVEWSGASEEPPLSAERPIRDAQDRHAVHSEHAARLALGSAWGRGSAGAPNVAAHARMSPDDGARYAGAQSSHP